MRIYLLKKLKNREYKSEAIVKFIGQHYENSDWDLEHDEQGAPKLHDSYISISDTAHYWICAIGEMPIGIDTEERSRKVKEASVKALAAFERKYLEGLESGSKEWNEEFLHIWTMKEAYMKLFPEALKKGTKSFSVIDKTLEYVKEPFFKDLSNKQLIITLCCEKPCETEIINAEYLGIQKETALEKAAQLIADRDYSQAELTKKLISKGYEAGEAAQASETLKERGYLDDARFAESYVRNAQNAGKGKLRILKELSLKGISRETTSAAFSENEEEGELERALAIASRIAEGKAADEKLKAKIARKLSSLGYDAHTVWSVIDRLF